MQVNYRFIIPFEESTPKLDSPERRQSRSEKAPQRKLPITPKIL